MNENALVPLGRGQHVAFPAPISRMNRDFAMAPLGQSISAPVWKGYAIILLFVFGFGVWASFAPLSGGAVAQGVVSPNTSRRTVQHLEGGIVREIKVHDGDVVREGQPLVVLEPVQPRSTYESLLAQRQALLARRARLDAEKDGRSTLEFSPELYGSGKLLPQAETQRAMFEARSAAHQARRNVMQQKIRQLNEQIGGFKAQLENLATQLSFIHEEMAAKQKLVDQGLLPRPEALRLRRSESELAARRAEFETEIRKATQQVGETNLEMLSIDAGRLDEITAGLDKVNSEMTELDERLRASEDVLNRTTIVAPVSGSVINLRFKTVGGVVQRGDTVLEIVPNDDALIVEAKVSPNDIRLVHVGQMANIHLAAYSVRTTPRIRGTVRSASADRVTDGRGDQSYFMARVEIDRKDLEEHAPGLTVVPGMSADVIFVTEKRTLLDYLLSPVLDVLRRGLHET